MRTKKCKDGTLSKEKTTTKETEQEHEPVAEIIQLGVKTVLRRNNIHD
jgi:hypothetical protein